MLTGLARLQDILTRLLVDEARTAMKALDVPSIDPGDLREYLARLRHSVAPAYLPFATYDGSMLVLHLWPGRPPEHSPVLFVSSDDQQATFICNTLTNLPTGLWLWVGRYFDDRQSLLRTALETITTHLPGARPVPEALWPLLEGASLPTWWELRGSEVTAQAWRLGDVGHPFLDFPSLRPIADKEEALPALQAYVDSHPDAQPELLAALLATQVARGVPRRRDLILKVLSAEAWRGLEPIVPGVWRKSGEGMPEWDSTLRYVEQPEQVLGGTPFEPLIGHPRAYSGQDEQGPQKLVEVSERFRAAGDLEGALRQVRNAAQCEVVTDGSCSEAMCLKVAEACEALEPGSLAAELARGCALVKLEEA